MLIVVILIQGTRPIDFLLKVLLSVFIERLSNNTFEHRGTLHIQ